MIHHSSPDILKYLEISYPSSLNPQKLSISKRSKFDQFRRVTSVSRRLVVLDGAGAAARGVGRGLRGAVLAQQRHDLLAAPLRVVLTLWPRRKALATHWQRIVHGF